MALRQFDNIQASESVQTVQSFLAAGNTVGNTTVTGGDVYFSGGNNITISMSSNSIGIIGGAGGGGGSINVSAGATSNNLTNLVFSNTAGGVSFGLNGSTITASAPGAAPSPVNISAGTTSGNLGSVVFSNSNNASFGLNGSTVTVSSPVSISAGTTNNNFTNVVFSNSNNVSFGLSGSSITASFNDIDIGLSNIGNTSGNTGTLDGGGGQVIFAGGNNVTLSGSINGQSQTITVSGLSYSNSNGVSFGINGGTLTADARNILSTYEPYPAVGASTVLVGVPTNTSAAVSVYPFVLNEYVSAGILNIPYSMSFVTLGTSSGQQTMGVAMGIYSRNVSTLSSIVSTSFSIQVSGNNSSYSINQPTSTAYSAYGATAQTNSAGINITSGYTGMKLVGFPINTLLTPGNYWLAMIGTNSTSSVNVGISMSHMGAAMATFGSALAPIGSFTSAYTSGQNPVGGRWYVGQGSWTSAGSVTMIPASMNFASITAVGLTTPLMKFWST